MPAFFDQNERRKDAMTENEKTSNNAGSHARRNNIRYFGESAIIGGV